MVATSIATIEDIVVMGRRNMKITFDGTPITPLKLSNPNELQWASHQVAIFNPVFIHH